MQKKKKKITTSRTETKTERPERGETKNLEEDFSQSQNQIQFIGETQLPQVHAACQWQSNLKWEQPIGGRAHRKVPARHTGSTWCGHTDDGGAHWRLRERWGSSSRNTKVEACGTPACQSAGSHRYTVSEMH